MVYIPITVFVVFADNFACAALRTTNRDGSGGSDFMRIEPGAAKEREPNT